MAERIPPRKPTQPLGHIVFPRKGRPYTVLDPLPEIADDLELVIVKKFIGALKHFEDRTILDPVRGNPWPDFEAEEDRHRIGIEVVEVLNPDHARKRALQEQYRDRILSLIEPFIGELTGLSILFDDGHQDHPYPALSNAEGSRLAQSIAENLYALVPKLGEIRVGQSFHFKWQDEPGKPRIGTAGQRFAPKESGFPVRFRFSGTFPSAAGVHHSLLAETIMGKVRKTYQTYRSGQLILLAYGHDPCIVDSPSIELAKRALSVSRHPFNEVWSFFPYAAKDLGAVAHVWP